MRCSDCKKRAFGYGLPLLILPLTNIVCEWFFNKEITIVLFGVESLLLLFSACAEEVAFRIITPYVIERFFRLNIRWVAAVSSLIFALFHFTNMLNGAQFDETILQVVFAFGTGYALFSLSRICETVIPGIIIHYLINITGCYHQENRPIGITVIWLVLSASCFVYGKCILHHCRPHNDDVIGG